jgi:GMP synthase-like glutamine amidotransferase
MSLRIHYLQHVPFEGLGSIEAWVNERGHQLARTRLFAGDPLPAPDAFDWLIVMGGPMGTYDEALYPWLVEEKRCIRAAIDAGRSVLGICLGSQLIANALGAQVYPGPEKEIGWLPIRKTDAGRGHPLLVAMPDEFTVFHWHGDTFDLPEGAELLASSDGCRHQAFISNDRVVGLQFHFEATPAGVEAMLAEGADELDTTSRYVHSADTIRAGIHHVEDNNRVLRSLLAHLEREAQPH